MILLVFLFFLKQVKKGEHSGRIATECFGGVFETFVAYLSIS